MQQRLLGCALLAQVCWCRSAAGPASMPQRRHTGWRHALLMCSSFIVLWMGIGLHAPRATRLLADGMHA